MSAPLRILIIRLSSLGDILHALPALHSLRAAFPDSEIDWLVEARMRFLPAAVPGISHLYTIDTKTWRAKPWSPTALREFRDLIRLLRARRYDMAFDFQGLIKTGLLARLSAAKSRFGLPSQLVRERPASWFYDKTIHPPPIDTHVARLNLELAIAAGGIEVPLTSDFCVPDPDALAVEEWLRSRRLQDFVIVNPGGGWYTKRWKPERYGTLARKISDALGLRVVVTTGPGEDALYRAIQIQAAPSEPVHCALPFLQLIPLYQKARLFVGGDTGPLHLATAIGTPVVGIYGPTSPIWNGSISQADEAVFHKLHCSFCYGRTCPTQNECMDISVDEVFLAVVRRLNASIKASEKGAP